MTTRKEKIYIAISIIFISFMVLYYGGRFIYYYKTSHVVKESGQTLLSDVIKSLSYNKAMVTDGENIYYSGKALNNYLYYSNRYYRIIGVEDNKVILIDDSIASILPYYNDFKASDINEFLENNYYNSLIEPEKYLADSETCIDSIDGNCAEKAITKVGMLSYNLYSKSLNNGTYLDKNTYYWLSNKGEEYAYIDGNNKLETTIKDSMYGVRPIITLNDNVKFIVGTGTYYDPYFIVEEESKSFYNEGDSILGVGSYINYSNLTWKVIQDSDTYKLVLNDTIDEHIYSKKSNSFNLSDKNSLAYYLNNDYYDTLDKALLVKTKFNVGNYQSSIKDIYDKTLECYVGLQELIDLYINDIDNSLLMTGNKKGTIYKINNGRLYADSYTGKNVSRPVISISKNFKIISGNGTIDSPYEVEYEA